MRKDRTFKGIDLLRNPLILLLFRHLAALACVALATLILRPFASLLEIQLIALLYLLPVLVGTVFWGLTPGILSGFLAFLSFNFFFIQPYFTFQVFKTQDLITLIIFLIVAVLLSQSLGQAREGIRLARSREWEATHMYELISALAGLQETCSVAQALANYTLETFHFEEVEIYIEGVPEEEGCTSATATSTSLSKGDGLTEEVLLVTARGKEGKMRFKYQHAPLTTEEKRLLEAYTSQGALSLERIRLMQGENKARVLEESDRLKSALLNSVSHELRSPLAAIKACVSSLRSHAVPWNTAAREDLLATIEEETDHLNLLVGNLLDMSRIEAGALEPQIRWNSIMEIAMGVITKMRKQLQGFQLEIDFPEDLPLVPTDYIMIEQVFTNLLSNSIKYAPNGTKILVSVRTEPHYLHVQVANQGPPVADEYLKRIFEKFNRVTEADRVGGTGLGLSICKGIVEAHGGKIWAENQEGFFVFHFLLSLTLNGDLPNIPLDTENE